MKAAVVTGISLGIGKVICETLVGDGYFVHGIYRRGKGETKRIKQLLESVEIYYIDASDRQSTDSFTERMKAFEFDAIVNTTAMINFHPVDEFDYSDWDETLEANLSVPLRI